RGDRLTRRRERQAASHIDRRCGRQPAHRVPRRTGQGRLAPAAVGRVSDPAVTSQHRLQNGTGSRTAPAPEWHQLQNGTSSRMALAPGWHRLTDRRRGRYAGLSAVIAMTTNWDLIDAAPEPARAIASRTAASPAS